MREQINEGEWCWDAHVQSICWSQGWVIETANIWPIQIIQQNWVHYLLDRNASNVFCREERKGDARDRGWDWTRNIHSFSGTTVGKNTAITERIIVPDSNDEVRKNEAQASLGSRAENGNSSSGELWCQTGKLPLHRPLQRWRYESPIVNPRSSVVV